MGQRVEPSFKDVKLINRLYCTRDYPYTYTLSKSIDLGCDVKGYQLNKGKCKNGGYPDPLKKCKCLCPRGYGGDDCTEYEYDNCRVIKLTAKVKKQYISTFTSSTLALQYIIGRGKCFFAINLEKADDKIKAKRITIKIERLEGFDCKHLCENNYIEIKYLRDKSATGMDFAFKNNLKIFLGARICCINYARILSISSEEDTEILIMRKGYIGEYDISYKADLAPSQDSANCIQVDKSIYNGMNLQTPHELVVRNEKGERIYGTPNTGPRFCLTCNRNNTMNINGIYSRNDCVEKNNPDPKCLHHTCFYCKVKI
ncbi:unnamed protein product [Meloidogyne enterolobii]|uniref:Uncharacterized protein n=1 Tax=Meloidogyne enterolobii TaxID=390850 RepID=A0ACB0YYS1_MELEN